jgi:NAD(P)-dependent dehydrogenase (short-subunit alcohol dehydrogenase family)
VNLRGPVFWCQAAWRQAFKAKPGVIINISSVGGLRAEAVLGVYNVTKAGMIHLTRQLAAELGPTRVVGIAPGLIDTDFSAMLVENFGDRLKASMPLKRLGTPADIAALAETYVVDGGAGVRTA